MPITHDIFRIFQLYDNFIVIGFSIHQSQTHCQINLWFFLHNAFFGFYLPFILAVKLENSLNIKKKSNFL